MFCAYWVSLWTPPPPKKKKKKKKRYSANPEASGVAESFIPGPETPQDMA